MRLSISQRRFDRVARAVFSAAIGFVSAAVCLVAGADQWVAIAVAVVWTAYVGCDMEDA